MARKHTEKPCTDWELYLRAHPDDLPPDLRVELDLINFAHCDVLEFGAVLRDYLAIDMVVRKLPSLDPSPGLPPLLLRHWEDEDRVENARLPDEHRDAASADSLPQLGFGGPVLGSFALSFHDWSPAPPSGNLAAWEDGIPVSLLDHHDDPTTRAEEHYSRYVADDLSHAYRAITRRDHRAALQHLECAEGAPMSRRQSIRLHYLFGICLLVACALLLARDHLARALGQLEALSEDEPAALARIAILAAEVESNMEEFGRAADLNAIAREALQRLRTQAGAIADPTNMSLEIDVLLEASKQTFLVEQYEDSVRLLEEARSLLVPATDRRSRSKTEIKQRGTIEWIAAIQDRWRGEPWPALGHALAASRIHELMGEPRDHGRILTVVADIVLDLLEYDLAGAPEPDRETFLALASLNADRAIGLCRSDGDPIGSELACLAKVRYLRVRKDTADRIPTIQAVMRKAEDLHNRALLAQAMTALGFEASASGDDEGALHYHRQAVELLENTDMKAMAVWSCRELHRVREMKP